MNDDFAYKGFRPGVQTLKVRQPSTLLEVVSSTLAEVVPRPPLDALALIELGSVYVNGDRSLNPTQPVKAGDEIRAHTSPRRFMPPKDIPSRIISETDSTLLVEKPSGLPSEPLVDNLKENWVAFLENYLGRNLYPTHRLSANSEGLMLIAKNRETQERIARAFAGGRVRRTYVAVVESPVDAGAHLISGLQDSPEDKDSIRILNCEQYAAETYLITEGPKTWRLSGSPIPEYWRVTLEFAMARPKDIRSYLAARGAPIVGDVAHGSRFKLIDIDSGRVALAFRAVSLSADPE